jgi:hypothetical protein
MLCRNRIVKTLPILLVTLLFALVATHRTLRAAEPEFALIVRNEEGRETRMSMDDFAKFPRVNVRARTKEVKRRSGKEARCMRF